jgi:putative transposase
MRGFRSRTRCAGSQELAPPFQKAPRAFPAMEVGFRSTIIFVTLCTHRRRSLLANDEASTLIVRSWEEADYWRVGRYVIMPNHIHLFCAPSSNPIQPLKKWISYWRNLATKGWPNRDQIPIWQREFWDRQLRRQESYAAKWDYVKNNAVRHGLVAKAQDWPYQGELNPLAWHDP